MTDIVEKLREEAERASLCVDSGHEDLCTEAADEIERLRRQVESLERAILPWIADVGWLNAEYDRLTSALRGIGLPGSQIVYCRDGHEMAVLHARYALKGSERARDS
jgi:hypothetical protein